MLNRFKQLILIESNTFSYRKSIYLLMQIKYYKNNFINPMKMLHFMLISSSNSIN